MIEALLIGGGVVAVTALIIARTRAKPPVKAPTLTPDAPGGDWDAPLDQQLALPDAGLRTAAGGPTARALQERELEDVLVLDPLYMPLVYTTLATELLYATPEPCPPALDTDCGSYDSPSSDSGGGDCGCGE